ncbi:hypothetical protein F9K79_20850 [Ochrobactrum sp. Kaboul]|nr:hypothetical protein F9K79_20850 [Ochrobactrum sp. Kaboul]
MSNKEDDSFAMSILCVGTAVYMAVCAMAFGGMLVISPSVGQAFLDFAKDYGALVAGIPVLIAVIVAKQQLDANRDQHRATIKLSFQAELDALSDIAFFAAEARDSTIETASKTALNHGLEGLVIDCPDKAQLKKYRSVVPYHIAELTTRVSRETFALYEDSIEEGHDLNIIELRLDEIRTSSSVLLSFVDDRLKKLAENWS